jgi:hypothetical protein
LHAPPLALWQSRQWHRNISNGSAVHSLQDRAARAPAGKWYLHAAPFIASLFSNCATSRAFTLLDLCAEPLFLLAELRCELGAEILGFEHLADLDLSLRPAWDWDSA